ncbi:hypothetical protein [Plebeiibacterium sediminum]|uniref:Uncharacterized protein n=1 Tax=Plebeiibacterium sediminum TaxID=2992112 RepID=A0AAE3SFF2_9BACT|nr:hypothetical protein [Plebeiobacterium sediminum]MCW3787216.1 hypothetical protein [Plebeiobacterium sediminum]
MAKVKETSNAITDQFVAKCIRACLRSTFFDGANFYQDNQTRHTLIEDVRVKSIKDNLSLADNRKVLKFLELELDYLKCYEQGVANRDYIDSPQWRFFLNETIENYKEQLPKPGKLNFNFTIYDNELNDIYTFLISNKLIDTSRKEFRKVLVEQEGKINWIDSSKKLAVLISILSTRTILFSGFRNRDLQEFVICYFTINKKQIKEMSYLIKNKKELADNKVRLKYHNTLIQILNFIPSVYQ